MEITIKRIKAALVFFAVDIVFLIPTAIIAFRYIPPSSIHPSTSATRMGTVEGVNVKYVQNEIKYIPLTELKLDSSSVKDGERLQLAFDSKDQLLGARTIASVESFTVPLWFCGMMSVLIIPICISVARNWNGGAFTISELSKNTYRLTAADGQIYINKLAKPEVAIQPGTIKSILKRKCYSSGVSRVWAMVYWPKAGVEKRMRFWLLNTDPNYEKLIQLEATSK